jgi:hypothetical protein
MRQLIWHFSSSSKKRTFSEYCCSFQILLRALRDFNIGKLVNDDVHVFMGLLNDLFPKTVDSVPRARDLDFEEHIKTATKDAGLQPENKFLLKVTSKNSQRRASVCDRKQRPCYRNGYNRPPIFMAWNPISYTAQRRSN